MNEVQTIQSGEGELKDYYENDIAKKALKKRRLKKMSEFGLVQEGDLNSSEAE